MMIDELAITMDSAKRRELNWAIQKEIADQIPFVMVFHRNSIRIAKAGVRNFDISAGVWHINRALKDAVVDGCVVLYAALFSLLNLAADIACAAIHPLYEK